MLPVDSVAARGVLDRPQKEVGPGAGGSGRGARRPGPVGDRPEPVTERYRLIPLWAMAGGAAGPHARGGAEGRPWLRRLTALGPARPGLRGAGRASPVRGPGPSGSVSASRRRDESGRIMLCVCGSFF